MQPLELSATDLVTAVRQGDVTAVQCTEAFLRRIEAVDGAVNAFLKVDREGALKRAAEIDARERPDDATTLRVLAACRYYCDQPLAATHAAEMASQAGAGAEAAYYLGLALAALGEQQAAREALIRAADLAPASPLRQRAELALMALR